MKLRVVIEGPLPKEMEGLTDEQAKAKLIEDGAYDPAFLLEVHITED